MNYGYQFCCEDVFPEVGWYLDDGFLRLPLFPGIDRWVTPPNFFFFSFASIVDFVATKSWLQMKRIFFASERTSPCDQIWRIFATLVKN